MIKKLFSKLSTIFFLVAFLFSTFNVNVVTYAYDTGMRDISGLNFVKDMKVGWNLGNTFDAGNETDWGNPYTTHAMIDEVKKEGFNTLRLPVSWYKHIGSAPNYTIDSTYMNRVEEVVKYAFDNNMYVILNIHHDNTWIVPTYAHEAQTEDELTKVWTQIANHFQSYNDHLVFEAMNEPRPVGAANEWSGGSYENRDVINKFNATAVKAIRATGGNNTKRFIMVPTIAASDQSVALNDFVLPNDSRLIVSLHMYTPYYFAMSINESGSTSTWGSDSDKAAMNSELDVVYNKFIKRGQAVVIGEFGSINKSNESSRVAHAKYFAQAASSRGITPIWWDNGIVTANTAETYAIFNRNALTWYFPNIARAFVDGTNGAPTPTTVPTVTPKPTAIPTVTPKPTAVPTVTPKPTAVPTVTPKPTTVPTVTPTPTSGGNIQVKMFNGTTASSSNAINPKFILTNTGKTAINLSTVKVRYYYTIDGDKSQNFWCDWSTIGSGNVTGKMVKMTTPKTNADYYIEVGFTSTAGSLNPGSSVEVQTRVSKADWSNYTQTNDYSFNSTASSYIVSNKVTAFINSSLSFGIEP